MTIAKDRVNPFKHRRWKLLSIPPYIQGVCVFLSAAGENFLSIPLYTQGVYVFLSAAGENNLSIPPYTQGVCAFLSAAGENFFEYPTVYTRDLCILKRRRREIF